MNALWLVTSVSLVAALTAWHRARRTAKRLEQLTLMLWELKYQHSELRASLPHLNGAADPGPVSPPTPPESPDVFVPLSTLKRDRS